LCRAQLLACNTSGKAAQHWTALDGLMEKSFPQHWRCLRSTWLVATDLSPDQARALLLPMLDGNDELPVCTPSLPGMAWQGREIWPDWLHSLLTQSMLHGS